MSRGTPRHAPATPRPRAAAPQHDARRRGKLRPSPPGPEGRQPTPAHRPPPCVPAAAPDITPVCVHAGMPGRKRPHQTVPIYPPQHARPRGGAGVRNTCGAAHTASGHTCGGAPRLCPAPSRPPGGGIQKGIGHGPAGHPRRMGGRPGSAVRDPPDPAAGGRAPARPNHTMSVRTAPPEPARPARRAGLRDGPHRGRPPHPRRGRAGRPVPDRRAPQGGGRRPRHAPLRAWFRRWSSRRARGVYQGCRSWPCHPAGRGPSMVRPGRTRRAAPME